MLLTIAKASFWFAPELPPIVYDCSVSLPKRHFLAVVGESGSGKSTLLRLASGLLRERFTDHPDASWRFAGSVSLDDKEIVRPDRRFGYVPQHFSSSLAPWLTARQNVLLSSFGKSPKKLEVERAERLLELAGVIDVAEANIRHLSGGQQQRVAICRALLGNPEILFMDEPFANLDPSLRPEMSELLKTVRVDTGLSVMIVTHDTQEASRMADSIFSIRRGYGRPEYREWIGQDLDHQEIEQWTAQP